MLDKHLLQDWAQYQKGRCRERRNRMPIFEDVLCVVDNVRTEVDLLIHHEKVEIRPRNLNVLWPLNVIIRAEHLSDFTVEDLTIKLILRGRQPYTLIFGTEQAYRQAIELIRRIASLFSTLCFSEDKNVIFEGVICVDNDVQIEVHLYINHEKLEIRPRDPNVSSVAIRAKHFTGFSPENLKITLSMRWRQPYTLIFGTEQAYRQAIELISRIAK